MSAKIKKLFCIFLSMWFIYYGLEVMVTGYITNTCIPDNCICIFLSTSFINTVHTLRHRRGPKDQSNTQWTFNVPCIIIMGYRFPYINSDLSTTYNLK